MKPKMIVKLCTDFAMTVILLLLMPYELIGRRLTNGLVLRYSHCLFCIIFLTADFIKAFSRENIRL